MSRMQIGIRQIAGVDSKLWCFDRQLIGSFGQIQPALYNTGLFNECIFCLQLGKTACHDYLFLPWKQNRGPGCHAKRTSLENFSKPCFRQVVMAQLKAGFTTSLDSNDLKIPGGCQFKKGWSLLTGAQKYKAGLALFEVLETSPQLVVFTYQQVYVQKVGFYFQIPFFSTELQALYSSSSKVLS